MSENLGNLTKSLKQVLENLDEEKIKRIKESLEPEDMEQLRDALGKEELGSLLHKTTELAQKLLKPEEK